MSKEKYIGMLSGTSMDALDCVLVQFNSDRPEVLDFACSPIPPHLKHTLEVLARNERTDLMTLGSADVELGKCFAAAALRMLEKHHLPTSAITAIASHGQTIWHQPVAATGGERFTLQIGDPSTIAALTGITTVADFRRQDMAVGGQGAPLVPAFHRAMLYSADTPRAVLNLGGIANITILPAGNGAPFGYDTGPANILMDYWIAKCLGQPFDEDGHWGASGQIDQGLLAALLDEPYFARINPKSTGRELFNAAWLERKLSLAGQGSPADTQATLAALTVHSVGIEICKHLTHGEVLVCGGGARNAHLMRSLQEFLPAFTVRTTTEYGFDGDCLEAVAFAWFAKQTLAGNKIDFTPFTGATKPVIAGGIYRA